jgi:hypothetical protein
VQPCQLAVVLCAAQQRSLASAVGGQRAAPRSSIGCGARLGSVAGHLQRGAHSRAVQMQVYSMALLRTVEPLQPPVSCMCSA